MRSDFKKFMKLPLEILAIQFLGKDLGNDLFSVRGVNLPIKERECEFWNKTHDTNLRVKYGEWIVLTNLNDIYPMTNEYLEENHYELID